ncbi:MAG: hypothetical protein ABSG11_16980, partial [Candidatus Korobacteraceae bacterium]
FCGRVSWALRCRFPVVLSASSLTPETLKISPTDSSWCYFYYKQSRPGLGRSTADPHDFHQL